MQLLGVYEVAGESDVHLIEMSFDHSPESVDVGKITQEVDGVTESSWQSPWDEQYLDEDGTDVIGDWSDIPKGQDKTRLLFYFHFLNFNKPLRTPFGPLSVPEAVSMPSRLSTLTTYESPD